VRRPSYTSRTPYLLYSQDAYDESLPFILKDCPTMPATLGKTVSAACWYSWRGRAGVIMMIYKIPECTA
jgi:hypothetical protein